MDGTGFLIAPIEYSKKIADSACGSIVSKKDKKYLIIDFPELSERETKLFKNILEDLKHSKVNINKKADIYFFLKNFCIENAVLMRKEQREKIILLLEWETLGESILKPILDDPSFEEIVINGIDKPIMVYHKAFGWLTTNTYFNSEEKVKTIINKMAAPLGRQLTYNNPILNATLKNGSRLNASMDPIAFSGINATIRKFNENPFTPSDIIETKTISKEAMAFLWLAMQTNSSILICGNTGSGKTTTLNSLFCFLPPSERIIVTEETPEIVLPQKHQIKLNVSEQLNIGLEKLIENTFRMRPDRIIVGEIRSREEAKAFVNTLLAGQAKGSYATFHAESAEESLERMKSFGIEENALGSIDLIVVQKRIGLIDKKTKLRREDRKVCEICEVVKPGKESNGIGTGISIRKLFQFDYSSGKLEKITDSLRVKKKVLQTFSIKEKEYKKLLAEKENLLSKFSGSISFNEFFELIEAE
jgi:archaeal flagellar protein FlaI